jgi:hypothetical protein
MRFCGSAVLLLGVAGCAAFSSTPAGVSVLTLNDPAWDRVNVEVVITKSADCDNRGEGFISMRELVMRKKGSEAIEVPNGATVCWRRDRNPNSPAAGAWSGWTKATLPPGQRGEADL